MLRNGLPGKEVLDSIQESFRDNTANNNGKSFELGSYRALLFALKGVSSFEEAESYLNPSHKQLHNPFLMKGMDKAVARINRAIDNRRRIMVYGDYDVDGTTSVAMMYKFLKWFGVEVFPYIPDRFSEGYGISFKGVEFASYVGADLIIALDCGIKAHDQAAYCRQKGIDLIICDHHNPGDALPLAHAVLDPKQQGCTYPFKELSGCGIGYKVMQAIAYKKLLHYKLPNQFLDLVAISIASDIVPMRGENRILARLGLQKLDKKPLTGVKALKVNSGVNENSDIPDIVFKVGPRINAAGRLGSAMDAFRLLSCENLEQAMYLAGEINTSNQQRKNVDESITEEAAKMVEDTPEWAENYSLVLANPEWHKGVIGIVASRIVEKYYKPTILLTESKGLLTGSARSIPGFDLYEAINSCNQYLEAFGGHKAAAGLSIKKEHLNEFREAFEKAVKERITEEMLTPVLEYDLEIPFSAVTKNFCKTLTRLGPYGPENMRPVFVSRNVENVNLPRLVGNNHVKMLLRQKKGEKLSAIGFKMGHLLEDLRKNPVVDICYSIEENHFNGTTRYELNLKDIKIRNEAE